MSMIDQLEEQFPGINGEPEMAGLTSDCPPWEKWYVQWENSLLPANNAGKKEYNSAQTVIYFKNRSYTSSLEGCGDLYEELVPPVVQALEALLLVDVIDKDAAIRASVERDTQALEPFLAGCVPDLTTSTEDGQSSNCTACSPDPFNPLLCNSVNYPMRMSPQIPTPVCPTALLHRNEIVQLLLNV